MRRLLVALALVCGLSLAVGAEAGGWVEWARSQTKAPQEWEPLAGFPTWVTCNTERKADQQKSLDLATEGPPPGRVRIAETLFACFPSDFDPRDKK
jgi:hypothetical protein